MLDFTRTFMRMLLPIPAKQLLYALIVMRMCVFVFCWLSARAFAPDVIVVLVFAFVCVLVFAFVRVLVFAFVRVLVFAFVRVLVFVLVLILVP